MNDRNAVLEQVHRLLAAYKAGRLGGEAMPEDENPHLNPASGENYLYFTLPMALNYQRNSYRLWECANRMYADPAGRALFDPVRVMQTDEETLRRILVQYRVALQPNRHPAIWKTLCRTIAEQFGGDLRVFLAQNHFRVSKIKAHIAAHKKDFPYLGGIKICNYWLHVLEAYTD